MLLIPPAHTDVMNKLKRGNRIIQVNNKWIRNNYYLINSKGTYTTINNNIIDVLTDKGKIKANNQTLIKEFTLNE